MTRAESDDRAGDDDPEEVCSHCGGWHFVRVRKPTLDELALGLGGDPTIIPCRFCHEKWETECRIETLKWRISASNLPNGSAQRHRFSTWKERKELEIAFNVAQEFAAGKAPHPFLTLRGSLGVGKTHLAYAIGWEWLENDRGTVRYWQVPYLLDQLRRGYNHEEGRASDDIYSLLDAAVACSLLLVDDLGMQKSSEWAVEKLDEIIDLRYAYQRHTVVTTNKRRHELPPRIASRLSEGLWIDMEAADWRRRG
jgi:DNA replication protein DnaC